MLQNYRVDVIGAHASDFDFVYELNKETMEDMIIKTWGEWDEEFQYRFLKERFNTKTYRIILVNGIKVGIINVVNHENWIRLDEVQLKKAYQGLGIGTKLVEKEIERAKKEHKELELQVLKANKKAKALCTRLGFKTTNENDNYCIMKFAKK